MRECARPPALPRAPAPLPAARTQTEAPGHRRLLESAQRAPQQRPAGSRQAPHPAEKPQRARGACGLRRPQSGAWRGKRRELPGRCQPQLDGPLGGHASALAEWPGPTGGWGLPPWPREWTPRPGPAVGASGWALLQFQRPPRSLGPAALGWMRGAPSRAPPLASMPVRLRPPSGASACLAASCQCCHGQLQLL